MYRIERAGPTAVQPYVVRFPGSTRRFLTKEAAADAIAAVLAAGDPRVKEAYEQYHDIRIAVTGEIRAKVLAENEEV